jgi:hypothetical protein
MIHRRSDVHFPAFQRAPHLCPLLYSLLMHSLFLEKNAASGKIHRLEPAQAHFNESFNEFSPILFTQTYGHRHHSYHSFPGEKVLVASAQK